MAPTDVRATRSSDRTCKAGIWCDRWRRLWGRRPPQRFPPHRTNRSCSRSTRCASRAGLHQTPRNGIARIRSRRRAESDSRRGSRKEISARGAAPRKHRQPTKTLPSRPASALRHKCSWRIENSFPDWKTLRRQKPGCLMRAEQRNPGPPRRSSCPAEEPPQSIASPY